MDPQKPSGTNTCTIPAPNRGTRPVMELPQPACTSLLLMGEYVQQSNGLWDRKRKF